MIIKRWENIKEINKQNVRRHWKCEVTDEI